MKRLVFAPLLLMFAVFSFSQEMSQVVKGKIYDIDTEIPLFGAYVYVEDSDPALGDMTDINGEFRIESVPLGRYNFRFSYMGYETIVLNEIMLSSGREVVLNVGLKESSVQLGAVIVKAKTQKDIPLNDMATLSARQLSVEEANRYAGGFGDPSRLAGSFAGVAQQIGNNGIVIRGNAPKGMLWQMEGVQISNPTHFANYAAFGAGGITALSSQVLANSDFFTGAFPSEYGNALSGVFDLKLRTGNNDKREYTFQAGLVGLDFSSEGPFIKGKRSSYIFNYRYSTLALLTPILPEEAGSIQYQDLSFKMNFPTKKAGVFSFWGLGAFDYQGRDAKENYDDWESDDDREDLNTKLFMGVLGLTYKKILSKKIFLNTTLAITGNGLDWSQKRLDSSGVYIPKEKVDVLTYNYTITSSLNHKFGSKHSNKSGITLNQLNYDIDISHAESYNDQFIQVSKDKGFSHLLQAYSMSKIDLAKNWILNLGLYGQYFTLNAHYTIEPRLGLKWNLAPTQSLGFAYGLHSQLEMITFYLTETKKNGVTLRPNEDMDFSKARHFVLSYDWIINENLRLKIEPFYQHLFNIPVKPGSSYSLLNIDKEWIITDTLLNEGEGINVGIDLTLERFLNRGFYYLITASFFDSKYKGGDQVWRDTRFNRSYVVNILAGKEWVMGKRKVNVLSLNGKITFMGGERYDPLLWDASYQAGEIINDSDRAFEDSEPHAQVLSFNISYRINKKKYSSVWMFSIINALGESEFDGYHYDETKGGTIEKREDALVIPNISYKIEF